MKILYATAAEFLTYAGWKVTINLNRRPVPENGCIKFRELLADEFSHKTQNKNKWTRPGDSIVKCVKIIFENE